ncbi:hypothetical protein AHF37_02377 [Paragonimus kellicotti]|nr:hypothetical protein AHF37_02377 [Paragonimus kellicotti]
MRWKDGYKYWNVRQIWQVLLISVPFFHCIYLTALWYQSNIFASVGSNFDNNGSESVGPINSNKWPECERIIAGESSISVFSELKNSRTPLALLYRDCKQLRMLTEVPAWLSEEERSFPIAYSISAYESLNQLLRLLRLIYRPQNLYCVHIDAKAPRLFTERASRYIRCFSPNVFLVPDQLRVNVKWGYFSVLEASLICANLSLQNNRIKWRYLLNVNEKELPLRTNWELVTALKALNGSNMVQLSPGNWSHRVPSKPLSFNLRMLTEVPAWLSEEERSFPIAYSISAYESLNQLLRLLRLIYRPQNLYCVHIDAKAPRLFTERASRYIRCFSPNVFLVPDQLRVNVKWGYFSVLEASLICANLSLQNNRIKWRYLLNVNEKELPLRTNWELVTALKALNGSNMVQLSPGNWSHRVPSKPLSFNITWRKGSFLVALRREFVRFMLTDRRAVEILEAFRAERDLLKVPDEMFFASLAYNPQLGAPGACIHPVVHKNTDRRSWQLARFVDWNWRRCVSNRSRNEICIFGVADLPRLMRMPHLFANKFLPNFQPVAYDCMEYWHACKLRREWKSKTLDPQFSSELFSNLYCSTNHI